MIIAPSYIGVGYKLEGWKAERLKGWRTADVWRDSHPNCAFLSSAHELEESYKYSLRILVSRELQLMTSPLQLTSRAVVFRARAVHFPAQLAEWDLLR